MEGPQKGLRMTDNGKDRGGLVFRKRMNGWVGPFVQVARCRQPRLNRIFFLQPNHFLENTLEPDSNARLAKGFDKDGPGCNAVDFSHRFATNLDDGR